MVGTVLLPPTPSFVVLDRGTVGVHARGTPPVWIVGGGALRECLGRGNKNATPGGPVWRHAVVRISGAINNSGGESGQSGRNLRGNRPLTEIERRINIRVIHCILAGYSAGIPQVPVWITH